MLCHGSNNKPVDCVDIVSRLVELVEKSLYGRETAKMSLWMVCADYVENRVVFHCGKCGWVFHTQSTMCPYGFPHEIVCAQVCAQALFALKNQ